MNPWLAIITAPALLALLVDDPLGTLAAVALTGALLVGAIWLLALVLGPSHPR